MTITAINILAVRPSEMEIDVNVNWTTSGGTELGLDLFTIDVVSLDYDPVQLPITVQEQFDAAYEVV